MQPLLIARMSGKGVTGNHGDPNPLERDVIERALHVDVSSGLC